MILIRDELPSDLPSIYTVNRLAFDRPDEAALVDLLRDRGKLLLSLVAVDAEQVVGHIAFSLVRLVPDVPALRGACPAPLAVLPQHQRQGIGAELCVQGLERCRRLGLGAVYPPRWAILIGHPDYYPRFGFLPAGQFDLSCKWPVPAEAFMALEFYPNALHGVSGMVEFEPEFDDVT